MNHTAPATAPPRSHPRLSVGWWFAAVNVPFLVGHPAWGADVSPLVRSLMINLVLFVAPGLWLARGRQRPSLPVLLLGMMTLSCVVFLGVLLALQPSGRWSSSSAMWNTVWLVSNLLLAGSVGRRVRRAPAVAVQDTPIAQDMPAGRPLAGGSWIVAALLFVSAYGLYFYGAIHAVPPQADHDLEVQGTGYGLLERMEPLLLTDRGTHYYFAHPLLLHYYVAGSFLYYDEVEHLRVFDEASRRIRAAREGDPFAPFRTGPGGERIIGIDGTDYLVDGRGAAPVRVPIETVELEVIDSHYARAPHQLETRTPTIFLAALTVALAGWWSAQISGRWWIGLLAGAAYATSPEVFVRSSYGGYFGISNFAVLMMLLTANDWTDRPARAGWWACLLAGLFAALANHKLVLLPVVLCLAAVVRPGGSAGRRRFLLLHPVFAGFVLGTAVFWAHGLLIDAASFWREHVRTHLIDRVAHMNPLGYTGYATPGGLWREFAEHTGYVLLPFGLFAMLLALGTRSWCERCGLSCRTLRVWLAWCVVVAATFTIVDWRMTKHLTPLFLPLHLAPVAWTAAGRPFRLMVAVVLAGLVVWNIWTLASIASDFAAFPITPAW